MVSVGSVSCVATDDSRAGALAVVGDGGQLLIYTHTQKIHHLNKETDIPVFSLMFCSVSCNQEP